MYESPSFNHLQKLSLSYFDRRKTGVIMSNLTNDVAALQTAVVDNLISFITESVTLIGSLVSMLLIDWKLTFVTFITVPVVLVIINVFGKKLRVAGHDVQGRVADITALLQEVISAIRVVKSFAREDFERKRFEDENDRNFKAVIKATKLTSLLSPMVEFFCGYCSGSHSLVWWLFCSNRNYYSRLFDCFLDLCH